MILRYFRGHPWQRRAITAIVTVVVGMLAAILSYPYVRDTLLIRDLGDENPDVRAQGIVRAAAAVQREPRFYRRLEAALETDSDTQFAAIVVVLRRVGKFNIPARDPLHVDRARALEIVSIGSDDDAKAAGTARRMILTQMVLSGRDNRYVRRALSAAASDEAAPVRRLAALLAARLGDDKTLRTLMVDQDAAVASAAALDAGLAMRRALIGDLARLLDVRTDVGVVSSAAYALAVLDRERYSGRICGMLRDARSEAFRDRLLHVMTVLADDGAKVAVNEILVAARERGELAPATAIVAGRKLHLGEARIAIRSIVADAGRDGTELRNLQVLAAFDAAWRWGLDVAEESNAFCRKRWGVRFPLTLIAAVRAIAARADEGTMFPRGKMIRTLRQAAGYEGPRGMQAPGRLDKPITTPVASAAAAVALWKLKAPLAERDVRSVAGYEETAPGDHIAWDLGQSGEDEAFELGLAMLPPPRDPNLPAESQTERVYNENERSAGAMLLALSARTPEQVAAARKRIESRLTGGSLGGEDNFCLRGAYQCALLILGESELRSIVRHLLATSDFPKRRAMTALLVAGDRYALDWMLSDPRNTEEYIAFLLIDKGLGEVLSACAPGLPRVDQGMSEDLLHWQVRILRGSYVIQRDTIRLGLKR